MYRKGQRLESKKYKTKHTVEDVKKVPGSKNVQVFLKGGGIWNLRWIKEFFKVIR